MDYLWSPWRYRYVTKAGGTGECIFCAKGAASEDEANLIIHRGERAFVLMNLYPYTTGHLMIAPYEHIPTLGEASPEVVCEIMLLTRRAERCLAAVLHPQGFNIGMNLGECAGAGVAGHIHMHAVPRWSGDCSFMTTVGETRVIPEDLETTYRRILSAWNGGQ